MYPIPSGASTSASGTRVLRPRPVSSIAATVSPPDPSRTSRVSNGSRRPFGSYFGTWMTTSAGGAAAVAAGCVAAGGFGGADGGVLPHEPNRTAKPTDVSTPGYARMSPVLTLASAPVPRRRDDTCTLPGRAPRGLGCAVG